MGNRVGNSEFVSDEIDSFLQDVAQMSGTIDYSDIMAFEKDVFSPKDKNLKMLKKLYRIMCRDAPEPDQAEADCVFLDVANIVRGVTDFNEGSNSKDLETLKYLSW